MNFSQEFEQQWTTLTNCLISEVLRSADSGKAVSHEQLDQLFTNEKLRWSVRGQYQNTWLELVRKSNPTVAEEFEKTLESLQLQPIIPQEKPGAVLSVGATAGGAVVGYGLAKLLTFSTLMATLGAVVFGSMGLGLGKTLQAKKLAEALAKDADTYKAQLQEAGKQLSAIVGRTEQ